MRNPAATIRTGSLFVAPENLAVALTMKISGVRSLTDTRLRVKNC